VHGNGNAVTAQAELCRHSLVIHLVNPVDLNKVIARAQRPQLRAAPLIGFVGYDVGVASGNAALVFDIPQVLRRAVSVLNSPGRAPEQHTPELTIVKLQVFSMRAHA